jgi:hypothetical protein
MLRRDFVKKASAAALASAAANGGSAPFACASDKAGSNDGNIFVAEWVQTGRVSFLRHVS